MKISTTLKNLLNNLEIQAALNQGNFKRVYDVTNGTFVTPEFTQLCLESNINPLNYMDEVPNSYLANSDIESIIIPDRIKTISLFVFYYCTKLTNITIPNSVTTIGKYAFYDCVKLMDINYNGTKEQWKAIPKGTEWKHDVPSTCKVHCTDGDINI